MDARSGEWVEVFFTYDPVEADIVRDILKSGGMEVLVISHRVGPYPVNIGKMGEIKVSVRPADAEAAREALSSLPSLSRNPEEGEG
jgi:hypothetical protein